MKRVIRCLLVIYSVPLLFMVSVFGADVQKKSSDNLINHSAFQPGTYSLKEDIAFVSVWGSRPDAKQLQGFERAILYNARGEVVRKIDDMRDSVYSLDKMIQENKSRGPLFIRMYRK